jgi:hypothetical protein
MAKNKFSAIAEQDARSVVEERLRISFKYLDWDSDEFFFYEMEIKYYQEFFDCIIVWFDPAHNFYPMNRGITKYKDVATVKCFSPDECLRLQEIIKELQKENTELYEALFNNLDFHQI